MHIRNHINFEKGTMRHSRIRYEYNRENWQSFVQNSGLRISELARSIGIITERHIHHILESSVQLAQSRTVKKIKSGLTTLGVPETQSSILFRKANSGSVNLAMVVRNYVSVEGQPVTQPPS
jgi:hypothetical protein